jgi:hypothetical protein
MSCPSPRGSGTSRGGGSVTLNEVKGAIHVDGPLRFAQGDTSPYLFSAFSFRSARMAEWVSSAALVPSVG